MSPLVQRISMKYTNETTLIGGMVLLVIGLIVRSIPFVPLLFIGTILIGIGIAIANVLLPGVIKERFPDRVPLMTNRSEERRVGKECRYRSGRGQSKKN